MTTTDSHPLRVLLVDDDKDDCDIFKDALKQSGVHATLEIASEGTRIMHLLNSNAGSQPHLIFLDLNMPLVSGTECLREIRRASYLNSIPVIIFSTSANADDVETTFRGGANLYIQKPSGFDALVNTLKRVLTLDWRRYSSERNRNNYLITDKAQV